jgi:hypothetical protein
VGWDNLTHVRALTAALAAGSLVGGYYVARTTKKRELGGVVLASGAAVCTVSWWRIAGPAPAIGSLATMMGAFGASHPLAKKIGAWPSVLGVAAVTAATSYTLSAPRTTAG